MKLESEIDELANELVKIGIVSSKRQALGYILELGLREARRLVERHREAKKLLEALHAKGLPDYELPTSKDVEEARSRG